MPVRYTLDPRSILTVSHRTAPSHVVVSVTSVHRKYACASGMHRMPYWQLTNIGSHIWQYQQLS